MTVPVLALLGVPGAGFRLDSVSAVTSRPAAVLGNNDRQFFFPVIGPAVTSSAFGWRQHSVLQRWLMHAGRDLAAQRARQWWPLVPAWS